MFDNAQLWTDRKNEFFEDHPKRCRVCRSSRKVELHKLYDEAPLGQELDSDLLPLCSHHTQSVLKYAKSVKDHYDLAEATEIWWRQTKAGKEPLRLAVKRSRKPPKTTRAVVRQRYANRPKALRHG